MPEVPAVSGTVTPRATATTLHGAVAAAFGELGPIARALPGFEARSGQLEMAAGAVDVFADGGVLLAEAGTGTGKTLAYLIPAILSRRRVLVSTGTKNLQEQIFYKDLPVLRESLGIPFTATYMKGRGNYLCLHRFESFKEGGTAQSLGFTRDDSIYVRLIDQWRTETATGDRAELEDLPEDLPFWKDIAASSENCIGTECPHYNDCFITRMRQRAAESDLVIVNHHLLCADAAVRQSNYGEVIPTCHYAVVDEAHQLEDVATQYFGIAVSNYRIDDLGHDVERAIAAKLVADEDTAGQLKDRAERIRDHARAFFSVLQMIRLDGTGVGNETRLRIGATQLNRVADEGLSLVRSLEALEAEIALAREAPPDLLALGTRAADLRKDLDFLLRADDSGFVYYLDVRGRGV
ncbi:MAG: ATP-dependent DNA helicase, partial [Vicinamibacterales bacterium]